MIDVRIVAWIFSPCPTAITFVWDTLVQHCLCVDDLHFIFVHTQVLKQSSAFFSKLDLLTDFIDLRVARVNLSTEIRYFRVVFTKKETERCLRPPEKYVHFLLFTFFFRHYKFLREKKIHEILEEKHTSWRNKRNRQRPHNSKDVFHIQLLPWKA